MVHHSPIPRRAGPIQGAAALLAACMPLVAFMCLPPDIPTLLIHFADTPGASWLTPLLVTAPSACIAIFSPLAGLVGDRFGRRRTLLAALAAFTASGAAPLLADNLVVLLACRIATGVANAALLTVGLALIGDYFDGEARRRWLAINSVAGSALITLAMLSGGVLAAWSWRGPLMAPFIGLPALGLAAFALFEPASAGYEPASDNEPAEVFPWAFLRVVAGLTLLAAIWFYVEPVQIGLLLDHVGVKSAPVIATVGAVASIGYPAGAVLYTRLCRRMSDVALMMWGGVATGVGLVGVGLLADPRAVCVLAFLQQVGGGVMITLVLNQAQQRFSFRHRARAMGAWAGAFFAGQFASPLVVAAAAALSGGLKNGVVVLGISAAVFGLCIPIGVRLRALRRPPILSTPPTEETAHA